MTFYYHLTSTSCMVGILGDGTPLCFFSQLCVWQREMSLDGHNDIMKIREDYKTRPSLEKNQLLNISSHTLGEEFVDLLMWECEPRRSEACCAAFGWVHVPVTIVGRCVFVILILCQSESFLELFPLIFIAFWGWRWGWGEWDQQLVVICQNVRPMQVPRDCKAGLSRNQEAESWKRETEAFISLSQLIFLFISMFVILAVVYIPGMQELYMERVRNTESGSLPHSRDIVGCGKIRVPAFKEHSRWRGGI